MKGKKRSKAIFSVMLWASVTGIFKMQPRFIWKTKKSLCFDKTLRPKTIVTKYLYYFSWLDNGPKPSKEEQGRNFCQQYWNTASHEFDAELWNATIVVFNSSMASCLQLCDAGLVCNFEQQNTESTAFGGLYWVRDGLQISLLI